MDGELEYGLLATVVDSGTTEPEIEGGGAGAGGARVVRGCEMEGLGLEEDEGAYSRTYYEHGFSEICRIIECKMIGVVQKQKTLAGPRNYKYMNRDRKTAAPKAKKCTRGYVSMLPLRCPEQQSFTLNASKRLSPTFLKSSSQG